MMVECMVSKESRKRYRLKHKAKIDAKQATWCKNNPIAVQWACYRTNAKKRNLSFELEREVFENLLLSKCTYCGLENCFGIDRKDNSKGYTKENSTPCCKICNLAKRELSIEDFLSWVSRISNYQQRKLNGCLGTVGDAAVASV